MSLEEIKLGLNAKLVLHENEIKALGGDAGPAVDLIRRHGAAIRDAARARAPRSKTGSHGRQPGYMASQITESEGRDARGFFVQITTEARTPKGFPYGSMEELTAPYLLPGARRVNRTARKANPDTRVRTRRTRRRRTTTRRTA